MSDLIQNVRCGLFGRVSNEALDKLEAELAQARQQIARLELELVKANSQTTFAILDKTAAEQQLAEARAHCAHCFCECPECSKR